MKMSSNVKSIMEILSDTLSVLANEETGVGATVERVAQAQAVLNLQFPDEFLAYLYKYGWADFEYFALFGLGDDVSEDLNLIQRAQSARMELHLPGYLLPVMRDGAGNYYCVNCDQSSDDYSTIVFWGHDFARGRNPVFVSDDFLTWVSEETGEILADD